MPAGESHQLAGLLPLDKKHVQISRRHFIASLAAFTVLSASPVLADSRRGRRGRRRKHDDNRHHDHEDAARARKSGDVLPLRDILEKLERTQQGEIVSIEFDKEDGVWVYEIKMVTSDGRYLEIYVNAKSNEILKIEGK